MSRGLAAVGAGVILTLTVAAPAASAPAPEPSPTTSERSVGDRIRDAAGDARDLGRAAVSGITPDCKVLPAFEEPGQSIMDNIDPGPPAPVDSLYGRYGYAGWSQVVYDPGCVDTLGVGLLEKLPGRAGETAHVLREEGGTTQAAGWLITASLFLIAVLTFLVRTAFGDGPFWHIVDSMTVALQDVIGARVYFALIGVTFVVVGTWFLARQRMESGAMAKYTSRFALIVAAGFLATGVHASLGPQVDRVYNTAGSQLMATAVGADEGITDAGTAVADVLISGTVAAGWKIQHLGYNPQVLADYGDRLHAARAFTRDEAAQAAADPQYRADLLARKEADFRQVAAELQQQHPQAYERLAKSSSDRLLVAWLVAGVVLLVSAVGGLMVVIVGGARIAWRALIGAAPGAAVFVAFPRLQPVALWAKDKLVGWTALAAFCTVGFVAYVRVASASMAPRTDVSLFVSFMALLVATGFAWWLWGRRGEIAHRMHLDAEEDRVEQVAAGAHRRARRAARASRRWVREHGNPPEVKTPEPEPSEAEPVKAPPVTPARVTDPAEAARGADAADDKARAASRTTAATNPAPGPRLTRPVPAGSSRPQERDFQAREAEELAMRRAKATLAGKTTRVATTAAVKAVPGGRPLVAALTMKEVLKR